MQLTWLLNPQRSPKKEGKIYFSVDREENEHLNALHDADASIEALFRGVELRNASANTLFVIVGGHGVILRYNARGIIIATNAV